MKKLLLATAAFVVLAPSAHAEMSLTLGGSFKGYAGYADQDTANLRQFDIKRKSQIFFHGETTLDNGMTIGYFGDMFQENSSTGEDNLEKSFIYFSGNWGRWQFGREDGAAYLLQVGGPSADSNLDGIDVDISFINLAGGNAARQDYAAKGMSEIIVVGPTDGDQYADKLTYITPVLNGFQAGITYSPETDQQLIGDETAGMDPDNTGGDLEHQIEAALRYDGEIAGIDVSAGAGYAQAKDETGAVTGDVDQWNMGLNLGYKGFSVGGGFITEEFSDGGATEKDSWSIGAAYKWGAFNVGTAYFLSEEESTDDEFERITLGGGYEFGPGMRFNVIGGSFDEIVNGADGNEGYFVATGTDIAF